MRPVKKGSTDQSVVIRIIDSTDGTPETGVEHDTAGIDLWYRREGAAKTDITEAALAALDSAHSDGGIEHIGDGYYRLDLPDAAFAAGANGVMIGGAVTGMIVVGVYIPLVDYDPYDAADLGLTNLTNHTPQTGDSYAIVNNGTYGNAKLVRSTTPANTLDVSATGEAGLDFDNIKDATGAHTLTNITVPTVTTTGTCTANSDMRGTDNAALAATALSNATWTDAKAGYLAGAVALEATLGSPAGASIAADIANVPTVTEFEARTLLAADYVVTSDTIAGVTTVTNLTNAPSNGDLTTTMKASVNAACDTALTDYGANTVVPDAAGTAAALIGALNDITVAEIIAGVADGSYDLQEMLRIIFAACAGKSSGGGTATLVFRDSADAKNRITATADANGNRTAITLDAS